MVSSTPLAKEKRSPFGFLADHGYTPEGIARMNLRHKHIIEATRRDIEEARILDLGSRDGRWPIAFSEAGAKHVHGIEGREEVVARFTRGFPELVGTVNIEVGDFVEGMDRLISEGRSFDVIACLGVYYHTMHHYKLMCQMAALKPKLIIIDSEFSLAKAPLISMVKEDPVKESNSIEQFKDQTFTPIGIPSFRAVEVMAQSVGYSMTPVNWDVPEADRAPVVDYFNRWRDRRRATVHLRPSSQ